jgi:subtilase family serine protease
MLGSRRNSRRPFRNAASPRRSVMNHPRLEELETRTLLSTTLLSAAQPTLVMAPDIVTANAGISPALTPGKAPLSPTEMRATYGVNRVQFLSGGTYVAGNGAGQTIAIVDADNDPTIVADLATFDATFGLQAPPSFTVLNQNGTTIPNQTGTPTSPRNSPHSSWSLEESLDVDWAHSIAPAANIVLFEANSASNANLDTAVTSAAKASVYAALGIPAASVISNSYGSNDSASARTSDLAADTSTFAPISNANQISLVFSSGDDGVAEFPSTSPYVLGVGGTAATLNVGPFGVSYASETTYNDTNYNGTNYGSSGGGTSAFEAIPSYQSDAGISNSGNHREAPDVSMSGALESGVYITDSYDFGTTTPTLGTVFGTSLAAPMWAGLIAVTNQGRALAGEAPIGNVQEAVYSLPTTDFHDITTGTNGLTGASLHSAGPGYDEVTGIGSPIANKMIPDLVAFTGTGPIGTYSPPAGMIGGTSGSASTDDGSNNVDDGYEGETYLPIVRFESTVALPASTMSVAATGNATVSINTIAPESEAFRTETAAPVTVAAPSAGQVVQVDAAAAFTVLPVHTPAVVEGFHGTSEAAPSLSGGDAVPTDYAPLTVPAEGFASGAATAAPAAAAVQVGTPAPAAVTRGAADAVFADFGVLPASEGPVALPAVPVAAAGEETHSVDLAMMAGLALALGGSWSTLARAEETRKNPALRN